MRILNRFLSLSVLANSNLLLAASAEALPWDTTLDVIVNSITGPIGTSISIITLSTSVAVMMFKSEISDLVMVLLKIALGSSVVTGSASFISLFAF